MPFEIPSAEATTVLAQPYMKDVLRRKEKGRSYTADNIL